MPYIKNKDVFRLHIFIGIVALFLLPIHASQLTNIPQTIVQRSASSIPMEPPSPRAQEPTVAELEKAAQAGAPHVQNELASRYFFGTGVAKDPKKAVEFFTLAANQGYAQAQNNLGALYKRGTGVAKDLKKAAELYTLAANQGNAKAQFNLGELYTQGAGVAKDPKRAVELFTLAANQGFARAQVALKRIQEQAPVASSSSLSAASSAALESAVQEQA